jgi:predicted amidohydrolase
MTTLRYKALALQVTCEAVNTCQTRDEVVSKVSVTLDRLEKQIAASLAFIGRDTRLVVLPEYFLTGFPMQESLERWRDKACAEPGGFEYERMGQIAQRLGIFLSGNMYEIDPAFPHLYFQVSFIIGPSGDVILRYRRLNSMFAPTPHDVWDQFLEIYGYEALFPVVDTEIGRLACIASEEILYPEIARCLAMRGAEVFCHHTSEVASTLLTQKNVAKLARSIESMGYVVSANSAGMADIPIPFASTDGASKVIDYKGLVLSESGFGESMVAHADIDLAALRHFRQRVAMGNLLARQRFELYAESYAKHQFYPNNLMASGTIPDKSVFVQAQQAVIEQLIQKDIFKK